LFYELKHELLNEDGERRVDIHSYDIENIIDLKVGHLEEDIEYAKNLLSGLEDLKKELLEEFK
jgi:hypothetical protein